MSMQKNPLLPVCSLQELYAHSGQEVGMPILGPVIDVLRQTSTQKACEVAGMTPHTFRTGRRIRNSNYASNR